MDIRIYKKLISRRQHVMDAYIHTCWLETHNPEMKFYRI